MGLGASCSYSWCQSIQGLKYFSMSHNLLSELPINLLGLRRDAGRSFDAQPYFDFSYNRIKKLPSTPYGASLFKWKCPPDDIGTERCLIQGLSKGTHDTATSCKVSTEYQRLIWTVTINTKTLTEAINVNVRQDRTGSSSGVGNLYVALKGVGTTTIIIKTTMDQTFDMTADLVVGGSTIAIADLISFTFMTGSQANYPGIKHGTIGNEFTCIYMPWLGVGRSDRTSTYAVGNYEPIKNMFFSGDRDTTGNYYTNFRDGKYAASSFGCRWNYGTYPNCYYGTEQKNNYYSKTNYNLRTSNDLAVIHTLKLNNNLLESFGDEGLPAKSIRNLDLSHNNMTLIPTALTGTRTQLQHTAKLDLSHNLITTLTESVIGGSLFQRCLALEECYFYKDVATLTCNIEPCGKQLNLGNNLIATIEPGFLDATLENKLEEIDLSNNRLTSLGKVFSADGEHPKLIKLDLSSNLFSRPPLVSANLNGLETLLLDSNPNMITLRRDWFENKITPQTHPFLKKIGLSNMQQLSTARFGALEPLNFLGCGTGNSGVVLTRSGLLGNCATSGAFPGKWSTCILCNAYPACDVFVAPKEVPDLDKCIQVYDVLTGELVDEGVGVICPDIQSAIDFQPLNQRITGIVVRSGLEYTFDNNAVVAGNWNGIVDAPYGPPRYMPNWPPEWPFKLRSDASEGYSRRKVTCTTDWSRCTLEVEKLPLAGYACKVKAGGGVNNACPAANLNVATCMAAGVAHTCTVIGGGTNSDCSAAIANVATCSAANIPNTCTTTGTNNDCAAAIADAAACTAATTSGGNINSANACVFVDNTIHNCVFVDNSCEFNDATFVEPPLFNCKGSRCIEVSSNVTSLLVEDVTFSHGSSNIPATNYFHDTSITYTPVSAASASLDSIVNADLSWTRSVPTNRLDQLTWTLPGFSLMDKWTVAITAQAVTEDVGVTVSQNEWTLNIVSMPNEWTFTIQSQDISDPLAAGVAVTQGLVSGTLKNQLVVGSTTSVVISAAAGVIFDTSADLVVGSDDPLTSATIEFGNMNTISSNSIESIGVTVSQNEWMFEIEPQEITESIGVTLTQGAATGLLKTALTGTDMTRVVISAAAGVSFVSGVQITIGSTVVVFGNVKTAIHSANAIGKSKTELTGASTSIVISTAAGVTFVDTADLVIGSTTIIDANVNEATNSFSAIGTLKTALVASNSDTTSVIIQSSAGNVFDATSDLIIGSTTVVFANVNTATIRNEITLQGLTTGRDYKMTWIQPVANTPMLTLQFKALQEVGDYGLIDKIQVLDIKLPKTFLPANSPTLKISASTVSTAIASSPPIGSSLLSSEEINQEIIASSPPIARMETSINFLSVEEINQELRKVRVELKVSSSIAMAIGGTLTLALPGFVRETVTGTASDIVSIIHQSGDGAFQVSWTTETSMLILTATRPVERLQPIHLLFNDVFIYPAIPLDRNDPSITISMQTYDGSSHGSGGKQNVNSIPYYSGGCVYSNSLLNEFFQGSKLELKKVQFENCSANNFGGGLYVSNVQNVNVLNSKFIDNSAGADGGALGYMVDLVHPLELTIRDSLIAGSQTGRYGAVTLVNPVDFNFDGEMGLATIHTINTVFENNTAKEGGAVWVNRLLNFKISDSTFYGNEALENGGALKISSADGTISSISVEDTTMTENIAGGRGGAMATQLMKVRLQASTLSKNSAGIGGGGLYAFSSTAIVNDATTFHQNYGGAEQGSGGGAMRVESCVSPGIRLYGANFTQNYGINQAEGGAIKSDSCALLLSECGMHLNYAGFGGAVALSSSSSVTTFTSTTLEGNKALAYESTGGDGGALYCLNCGVLKIQDKQDISAGVIERTRVVRNSAERDGGAFWIQSAQLELESIKYISNTAERGGGGAIFWSPSSFDHKTYVPTVPVSDQLWSRRIPLGSPQFKSNTAHFGNNIATISRRVALDIGDSVGLNTPMRAGELLPGDLSIFITDHYDQIVTRSFANMKLEVVRPTCDGTTCPTQQLPVIKSQTNYWTDDETGKVDIDGSNIFGQPGATDSLRIYVSDSIGRISPEYHLDIERCLSGEISAESMQSCQNCMPGRFSNYASCRVKTGGSNSNCLAADADLSTCTAASVSHTCTVTGGGTNGNCAAANANLAACSAANIVNTCSVKSGGTNNECQAAVADLAACSTVSESGTCIPATTNAPCGSISAPSNQAACDPQSIGNCAGGADATCTANVAGSKATCIETNDSTGSPCAWTATNECTYSAPSGANACIFVDNSNHNCVFVDNSCEFSAKCTVKQGGTNSACSAAKEDAATCTAASVSHTCTVTGGGTNNACAAANANVWMCSAANIANTCITDGTNNDCAAAIADAATCSAATTTGGNGDVANACIFMDNSIHNCIFVDNSCEFDGRFGARRVKPLLNHASCASLGTDARSNSDCETCNGCIPGRYQSEAGKTRCDNCEIGRISGDAVAICDDCAAGLYSNADNTVCPPCAGGKTTTGKQGSCDSCEIGTYRPFQDASPLCQSCAAGLYSNVDKTLCLPCAGGKTTTGKQGSCDNCESGTYRPFQDASPLCQSCAAGLYSNADNTQCLHCAGGKTRTVGNSSTCENCDIGTYRPYMDASPLCQSCVAGRYSNADNTVCLHCIGGKTRDVGNSSTCDNCDSGKFRPFQDANPLCQSCAAGLFTNVLKTSCNPCAGGRTSIGAADVCDKCDGGKYRSDIHAAYPSNGFLAPCTTCPEGFSSPVDDAATYCITCFQGRYLFVVNDALGAFINSTCNQCKPGRYRSEKQSVAGTDFKSVCTNCNAGSKSVLTFDGCEVCAAGTFSPEESSECLSCPIGTFSSLDGQSICQSCSEMTPGTAPNDASTACVAIPTCTNVLAYWEDPRIHVIKGNTTLGTKDVRFLEKGRLNISFDIPLEWKIAPNDPSKWIVLNPDDRKTWSEPKNVPIHDFKGYKIRWAESNGNFDDMETCDIQNSKTEECVFEEFLKVDPTIDLRTRFTFSIVTQKPLYYSTYYIRIQTVVSNTGKDSTPGLPGTAGGWVTAGDCGKSKYLNGTKFNNNGSHSAMQRHLAMTHELVVPAKHQDLYYLADTDSNAKSVLSLKFVQGDQSVTKEEYFKYLCMRDIREKLGSEEEDERSNFLDGKIEICELDRTATDLQFDALDTNQNNVLDGFNCVDCPIGADCSEPTTWDTCPECPHGLSCRTNKRCGVASLFGYWRLPGSKPQTFYTCNQGLNCLGAPNKMLKNRFPATCVNGNRTKYLAALEADENCPCVSCQEGQNTDPAVADELEGCRVGTDGATCMTCAPGFTRQGPMNICLLCTAESKAAVGWLLPLVAGIVGGFCLIVFTALITRPLKENEQIIQQHSEVAHNMFAFLMLNRTIRFLQQRWRAKKLYQKSSEYYKHACDEERWTYELRERALEVLEKKGKLRPRRKDETEEEYSSNAASNASFGQTGATKNTGNGVANASFSMQMGGFSTKAKIMVSWTQVVTHFNVVFDIPWPHDLIQLYNLLRGFVSFDFLSLFTGVLCGLDVTYLSKFRIHMGIIPLVFSLGMTSLLFAFIFKHTCCKHRYPMVVAWNRVVELCGMVVFFLYPGIAMKIFFVMKCRKIGDKFYLERDYRIECYAREHTLHLYLAYGCMLIYVIGYPLVLAISLWHHKPLITNRDEIIKEYTMRQKYGKMLANRTDHIWDDDDYLKLKRYQAKFGDIFMTYNWRSYYFELVEIARKVMMVGGLVILGAGTTSQVIIAILICIIYYALLANIEPYQSQDDNILAQCASMQLVFTLIFGLLLFTQQASGGRTLTDEEAGYFGYLLVGMHVAVLSFGLMGMLLALKVSIPFLQKYSYKEVLCSCACGYCCGIFWCIEKRKRKKQRRKELALICPTHSALDPWHVHPDLKQLEKYRAFKQLGWGPLSSQHKALQKMRKENGTLADFKSTKISNKERKAVGKMFKEQTAFLDKDNKIIYSKSATINEKRILKLEESFTLVQKWAIPFKAIAALTPASDKDKRELEFLKNRPSKVLMRQKQTTKKQIRHAGKMSFRRKSMTATAKRNSQTLENIIQKKRSHAHAWKRGHPQKHEDDWMTSFDQNVDDLHAEVKQETAEDKKKRLTKLFDQEAHKVEDEHDKNAAKHHMQVAQRMVLRRQRLMKRLQERDAPKAHEVEEIKAIIARPLSQTLIDMHKILRQKAKTAHKMEKLLDKIDIDRDGHIGKRELLVLTRTVAQDKTLTPDSPQHMELWECLHAMEASDHGMAYKKEILRETLMRYWQIGKFDQGSHFDIVMNEKETNDLSTTAKKKSKKDESLSKLAKKQQKKEEKKMKTTTSNTKTKLKINKSAREKDKLQKKKDQVERESYVQVKTKDEKDPKNGLNFMNGTTHNLELEKPPPLLPRRKSKMGKSVKIVPIPAASKEEKVESKKSSAGSKRGASKVHVQSTHTIRTSNNTHI